MQIVDRDKLINGPKEPTRGKSSSSGDFADADVGA